MEISYWLWLALGGILMAAELVIPGFYLLWVGMAGVPAAIIAYSMPDWGFLAPVGVFVFFGTTNAVIGHFVYAQRRKNNSKI